MDYGYAALVASASVFPQVVLGGVLEKGLNSCRSPVSFMVALGVSAALCDARGTNLETTSS